MIAVVEAKSILCTVPRGHAEPKGSWLSRVADLFRLTPAQARKIYYGEVKGIDADRLNYMRAKIEELQEGAAKRRELLDGLTQRTAELRSTHGSRDPEGGRGGTAPAGGRSDGTLAGRRGEG